MPRSETEDLLKQDNSAQPTIPGKLEDVIGNLMSINLCEFESSPFEKNVLPLGSPDAFDDPEKVMEYDERNGSLAHEQDGWDLMTFEENNQSENCANGEDDANEVAHREAAFKQQPLSWNERANLKIRYTRQYLLDRSSDPLSMEFPDCLLKFLQSGEVPLKEAENGYDYRRMDHILFYTSLPYTRMRNSLNVRSKRKPFEAFY